MNRVAIMGLGLMGGSLGLALRAGGFNGRIAAYARRPETRARALRLHAVDEAFEEPEQAVKDADLVVFCVPILAIPELAGRCRGGLKPGCLLTDVGSTKQELAGHLAALLKGTAVTYIGSHPMAGSEQQGLDGAREDLYKGAAVIVTPGPGDAPPAIEGLKDFWKRLGCHVLVTTPGEHDRLVARTSHLPHLAAALVAGAVGRDGDPAVIGALCGPGFRDTTRVADGSPEVWHDIIQSNRGPVMDELGALRKQLDRVLDLLERGDFSGLQKCLGDCREKRRVLLKHRGPGDERGEP